MDRAVDAPIQDRPARAPAQVAAAPQPRRPADPAAAQAALVIAAAARMISAQDALIARPGTWFEIRKRLYHDLVAIEGLTVAARARLGALDLAAKTAERLIDAVETVIVEECGAPAH